MTLKTLLHSASACALALCVAPVASAQDSNSGAASIGASIVSYANGKLNQRVGGGNSVDLAIEALRIAGGEFAAADLGTDAPATGDRVWGTLVTEITPDGDSQPAKVSQPGDLLQFGNAQFNDHPLPSKFTAVVAEVNEGGRPKKIFCQDLEGVRSVQLVSIDLEQLDAGWMRIYRPKARIDRVDEWKVTVVNNTQAGQSYDVTVGIDTNASVQAAASNSSGNFFVHSVSTDGTVPNLYTSSGKSYFLEHGKAYELYSSSNGVAIRQLTP